METAATEVAVQGGAEPAAAVDRLLQMENDTPLHSIDTKRVIL